MCNMWQVEQATGTGRGHCMVAADKPAMTAARLLAYRQTVK